MMEKGEALERIRRLDEEHESDHDGGYGLVWALKQAYEETDPKDRRSLAEALSDLVHRHDPSLWAVALETLVQVGGHSEVAFLGDEILSGSRDEAWRDGVALALARLGRSEFRDAIVEHVGLSLENPRAQTVAIVAALCRIDRGTCLELSAAYFLRALAQSRSDEARAYIPTFVRNFLAVHEHLLPELVQKVAAHSPAAGRWVADCLNEYVLKPWIVEEIGSDQSVRIRGEISAAAAALN
jgi:hypothetical protein